MKKAIFMETSVDLNKGKTREICIGLLPSHVEADLVHGHTWISWTREDDDNHISYRGYWPDLTDVPEEIPNVPVQIIEYIKIHSVRGIMKVDKKARYFCMGNIRDKILKRCWPILQEEKLRLNLQCGLADNQDSIVRGRYSWNEERPDWDNCSSWAIKIINYVKNSPDFISCERPKRLKYVTRSIFGTIGQLEKT